MSVCFLYLTYENPMFTLPTQNIYINTKFTDTIDTN